VIFSFYFHIILVRNVLAGIYRSKNIPAINWEVLRWTLQNNMRKTFYWTNERQKKKKKDRTKTENLRYYTTMCTYTCICSMPCDKNINNYIRYTY
jgi:hypothetical protein